MAGSAYDIRGPDAEEVGEKGQASARGAGRPPANRYRTESARSNLFLVGLFLAGAAGVYGLSLRKGPAQASADQKTVEAQVDSAILRLSQEPQAQAGAAGPGKITGELLQNFYDQISQRQVPLKNLRKNPFVFIPPAPQPLIIGAMKAAEEPTTHPVAPQKESPEEITAALARLHLQSVMMGRGGGSAIISNNLLTVGQTIEGFTVKSIAPNSVLLTRQNKDYELKMP